MVFVMKYWIEGVVDNAGLINKLWSFWHTASALGVGATHFIGFSYVLCVDNCDDIAT